MHSYICIDFKTFYASVECVVRGLDPFQTNLVVADPKRGTGAICLAISPKLKAMGVRNRCRIFEVPDGVEFITALPRMKLYMEYSANIYSVYLKYIAKDDIHVYSIDEAFLDVTNYLELYHMTVKELAQKILDDIYLQTGITATVGIGTNLYLAKVALDITAKHADDHMGYLDEKLYKKLLWHHQPLTDFWQVGRGITKRLAKYGITDMYGIAHTDEKLLYKEFGINAEYLIDHAKGIEPTTIAEIKNYKAKHNSISNNQILFKDYTYDQGFLVLKEMVEQNILELVEKQLVCDHIGLFIGYADDDDRYKHHGGSMKLSIASNSYEYLLQYFLQLYKNSVDREQMIRSIGISFGNVVNEKYRTYDLFTDQEALNKEAHLQSALIEIKHKYGKNAIIKGMNLLDHATGMKRNTLVGGHNAE